MLVTSAKSNTSLFAIQALREIGCAVYAVSTSGRFAGQLASMGVRELFVVDPSLPSFADDPAVMATARSVGGFNRVVDPYFDVNLPKVTPVMSYGGRYVTCGLADQYSDSTGQPVPNASGAPLAPTLLTAMMKNLHLIGNCLGSREDLERAIADQASGDLNVVIDSVVAGGDARRFIDRTFNAPDRFGKVVYLHDPGAGLG